MVNNVDKYGNETGTYTIKTIEGTGDRKQYWRLANQLVRNSNIYKSLSLKIYRLSAKVAIYRRWYLHYKKQARENLLAFRQFERDANRELKKELNKIKVLEKEVIRHQADKRKFQKNWYSYKNKTKATVKNSAELRKKLAGVKSFHTFITKQYDWALHDAHEKAELMLRAVVGFEELKANGDTNYIEFVYLCIGEQVDAFNKATVNRRFGKTISKYFLRDIGILMEKGYVKRFERREYYYITLEGREQLKKIISLIFSKQYGHYWNGVFENL